MSASTGNRLQGPASTRRAVASGPRPDALTALRFLWLLLAVLALSPVLARAETQRAQFVVSAYVAPAASVVPVTADQGLVLTTADVDRGYKDVRVRYRVSSNSAGGYVLQLATRAGLTDTIEVHAPGTRLQLGALGAEVARLGRKAGGEDVEFRYRLHLAAAARPGSYDMPVAVSASPL
jgi:hypothetical protein